MKALKYIFIGSVISLLIIGFGTFLLVDKFLWMKEYYWELKNIIRIVLTLLSIVGFSSIVGILILSLIGFNKQNGLK